MWWLSCPLAEWVWACLCISVIIYLPPGHCCRKTGPWCFDQPEDHLGQSAFHVCKHKCRTVNFKIIYTSNSHRNYECDFQLHNRSSVDIQNSKNVDKCFLAFNQIEIKKEKNDYIASLIDLGVFLINQSWLFDFFPKYRYMYNKLHNDRLISSISLFIIPCITFLCFLWLIIPTCMDTPPLACILLWPKMNKCVGDSSCSMG